MIICVQLAKAPLLTVLSMLRDAPGPDRAAGRLWSRAGVMVRLGTVPPRPRPGHLAFVSAWSDDDACDRFFADSAWAGALRDGYELRGRPVRAFGSWPALPELASLQSAEDPPGPVAALTLGRLRGSQLPRFLRMSARAERPLLGAPGLRASTGIGRPPLLSTFSVWDDVSSMRAYAGDPTAHGAASASHRAVAMHHEAVFIRLAPYRSRGTWNGSDPLATSVRHTRDAAQASS